MQGLHYQTFCHYTSEHTGTQTLTSSDKGGSSFVSATIYLATVKELPVMMRCEVPDYETLVVVLGSGDTLSNDDASLNSHLHAFMVVNHHEASRSDVNPVVFNGLALNFPVGMSFIILAPVECGSSFTDLILYYSLEEGQR